MTLQNLQAEFAEIIFSHVEGANGIQPADNLCIYQRTMQSNLVSALQNAYPLISQLVGDDFFRIMADEYITRYPSRSGNLHDYGEYFSDFLAEYPPVKNLIYLAEVAQFEWTCHTLYFAADPTPLTTELLEKIPQEQYGQLHFFLHPASYVGKFHYPLLRIIALCKGESDEPINLNEGGLHLLIIRRDTGIALLPLTPEDYAFLHALSEGHDLSAALIAATTVDPAFSLETKLAAWIQDQTLVDYCL